MWLTLFLLWFLKDFDWGGVVSEIPLSLSRNLARYF